MLRFRDNQRVFVLRNDAGVSVMAVGTVVRLRRADSSAWIALDERIEGRNVHPFPADDDAGRATHVLAMPDGCTPLE